MTEEVIKCPHCGDEQTTVTTSKVIFIGKGMMVEKEVTEDFIGGKQRGYAVCIADETVRISPSCWKRLKEDFKAILEGKQLNTKLLCDKKQGDKS